MFKILIWLMRSLLELAALAAIVIGAMLGDEIVRSFGLGFDNEWVHMAIGALVGATVAIFFFGLPIVLININDNLSKVVESLASLEKAGKATANAATQIPVNQAPANDSTQSVA